MCCLSQILVLITEITINIIQFLNFAVREGLKTIIDILSLTQEKCPHVLNTCLRPNMLNICLTCVKHMLRYTYV